MPILDVRLDLPQLTKRRLFDIPAGSRNIFIVGSQEGHWHRFARGYKNAADLVVERLTEQERVTEAACLPALFNYRHFVECSIKGMLLDAGEVLDIVELAPTTHPLLPLWNNLRSRLGQIDRSDDTWLDRAEELITELDLIDSQSFTFRYPVNKRGAPHLAPSHAVDIQHFKSVMDELAMVLGGIEMWLDSYVDMTRDMRSACY